MKREIFEAYVEAIVTRFKIKRKELFSKSSKRDLVEARYMLYYLCHKRPIRICNIEDYMGENHYMTRHSNIIAGIRSMEKKMEKDPDYITLINELEKIIAA